MTHIRRITALEPEDAAAVTALAEKAAELDGTAAFSEQTLLRVRDPAGGDPCFYLLDVDGHLVGAGFAEGGTAELVVAPAHRRRGYGTRLLNAILKDDPGIGVWSHGQHPGARALALGRGMTRSRGLRKMRMALFRDAEPVALPEAALRGRAAQHLRIRTYRPDEDDDALLATNRRAFRDHPEQGGMTAHDLRQRRAEDWFDSEGLFIAEVVSSGAIAGFHWTKVHVDGAGLTVGQAVGEVYVVGVEPGWQGTGLGRTLTLRGLRHLQERGLPWVLLYVEEVNAAAVHLYESLGFETWTTDVLYRAAL
jgi:mycothiol synthase